MSYESFSIHSTLNLDSDHIAISKALLPLNQHISTYSFSIYIKKKYTTHDWYNKIRIVSHAKEARDFLRQKYGWSS